MSLIIESVNYDELTEEDFNEFYAINIYKATMRNDIDALRDIVKLPPRLQLEANWGIEEALLGKRKEFFEEKSFADEYDEILTLYRGICEKYDYDVML